MCSIRADAGSRPRKIAIIEGLRGLAAAYVLVCHIALEKLDVARGAGGLLFQFSQEAVIVFFLVSGFVICYSVPEAPRMTAREFYARRFLRIYPIFLLALLLSAWISGPSGNLIANLAMLQDIAQLKPGAWFDPYSGNSALWTLSYEWWFYLLFFPLYRYVAKDRRRWFAYSLTVVATVAYSVFPNQFCLFAIYFSIWWSGAELARSFRNSERIHVVSQWGSLLVLTFGVAYFGLWALIEKRAGERLTLGVHPILESRHFFAALVMVFVACILPKTQRQVLTRMLSPFLWIAPISYAIYVFQMPLVVNANYLGTWPPFASIAGYLMMLILASFAAEFPFQQFVNRWASPILRGKK